MSTPVTALRAAAYAGDLVQIRNLLLEAVDPNVADEFGRTALSHAAGEGHIEVARTLLAAGAWVDPHEDYDTRVTPLMEAATKGHLDIVKLLVAAGANPALHVGFGQRTACAYAASEGHREIVDFLREITGE